MSSWHVEPTVLSAWVDGTTGAIAAASVEQHLVSCEQCRAAVAELVAIDSIPCDWDRVLAEVSAGRSMQIERALRRLGLRVGDAIVIGAAPVIRAAWAAALAIVLGFIVLASMLGRDGGLILFLALAPLTPVFGVAAAYGPGTDPSYELAVAAPYRITRLILLRSAAVLVTAVPIMVAAGLLLPWQGIDAVVWVVPSITFTVVVLCASAWVDPSAAAVTVALGWIAALIASAHYGDVLAVLEPSVLLAYGSVMLASALVLATRAASPKDAWHQHSTWTSIRTGRRR